MTLIKIKRLRYNGHLQHNNCIIFKEIKEMAVKRCFRIKAVKNNKNYGYVKSINYESGETTLTSERSEAFKYDSEDAVQYDIDFLAKTFLDSGYVFTY